MATLGLENEKPTWAFPWRASGGTGSDGLDLAHSGARDHSHARGHGACSLHLPARVGSRPGHCGNWVPRGQAATLTLYYDSGVTALTNEGEAVQSVTEKVAGIGVTLKRVDGASLASTLFNGCSPKTPSNNRLLGVFPAAGGYSYSPDHRPTGGQLYATGAGTNCGDYSNQRADQPIAATHTPPNYATEVKGLYKYENYISENLPMVEQPAGPVQLTMYKRNLRGLLPQGIGNQFFPQFYRTG